MQQLGSTERPGGRVSHYRIGEKLGGGGMGVVYRAEDTRLRRTVALKFLPVRWSGDDLAKQRFRREARSVSTLDHPNLCAVHEIDETVDGRLFIVLAYCDGETLKKKIERGGLPWEEAVDYTLQALDGMAAAHRQGIVHRDLKPANLMVTREGVVKIVDFGLAKLGGGVDITSIGQTIGTLAYMAPEQIRGDEADARSDLWALGVVLFEMLTGERPFQGVPGVLMQRILSKKTPSIAAAGSSVPPQLEVVVRRAMAKKPERRFASADEMAQALRGLLDIAASQSQTTLELPSLPPSVRLREAALRRGARWGAAVLAVAALGVAAYRFANRAPPPVAAPERPTLGVLVPVAEDPATVTSDLPRLVQALLVAELTGAGEFGVLEPLTLNGLVREAVDDDGTMRGPSLFSALRAAGLDYVVDGVVLAGNGGRRLAASLVRPESGETVFSRTVEIDSEAELPARVRQLATELLGYLQVQALGQEKKEDLRPWMSPHRHNVAALRAFVQATEYIYRFERGGGRYLDRAIELDPDFITARVWRIASLGRGEPARAHYRHLLTLEPRASPFEQAMIAWAGAFLEEDVAAEAQHLEIALRYSPGNYILLVNLGDLRRQMGDCGGALEAIAAPLEADWGFPPLYALMGQCLIEQERFQVAAERLEESLAIESTHPLVLLMLEALAIAAGDDESARRHAESYSTRSRAPIPTQNPDDLGRIYFVTGSHCLDEGRTECAIELLARAATNIPESAAVHQALGQAFLDAGESSAARVSFRRALALGGPMPRAHLGLGRIAEEAGAVQLARNHYERFLALDPTHPRADEIERKLHETDQKEDRP